MEASIKYVRKIDKLKELKETLLELEIEKKLMEREIKEYMGDAEELTFKGKLTVTYKKDPDRTVIDLESLLQDNPNLENKYSELREGSRRFLIKKIPGTGQ